MTQNHLKNCALFPASDLIDLFIDSNTKKTKWIGICMQGEGFCEKLLKILETKT